MKKETMIYGRHPVIEAIKAGTQIDKILLQQGTRGEFEKELRKATKAGNIPVQVIPKERLGKFTKSNHQGVIALLSAIQYYKLEDVLPFIYEQQQVPLILLLDGVTDVRNFGAIARTAECAGVQAIVIPRKGAAQINADAVKVSAGALNHIPVCRESSLSAAVEYLRLSGLQVLASDLKADGFLYEIDLEQPTALIIGSEDKGVNPSLLREVDKRFIIPITGKTDSYNVSVATGMMLYEALRQRMKS